MTSKSGDNGIGPSLIGLSAPSFLTVKNSPIYSGIIELTYNHTPLPISSGGTGLTSIGSEGQVLSVISTSPTPQLGWISASGIGTVTSISLSLPSFLKSSTSTITSSGTFDISYSSTPLPITSGGTGLTSIGPQGKILSSDGSEYTWIDPAEGTVTSISLSLPSFLQSSTSKITSSGSFDISYSSTPLPITSGGTGLTSIGPQGKILSSNGSEYTWIDPAEGTVTSISLSLPSFLQSSVSKITSSGSFDISYSSLPLPISSGGTGLTMPGSKNQILSSDGEKIIWKDFLAGSVYSVGLSTDLAPFLSVSNTPITTAGTLSLSYTPNVALPFSSGGTGLTTIGLEGQILISNGEKIMWDYPKEIKHLQSLTAISPLSCTEGPNPQISISSSTGSNSIVLSNSPTITTPTLISPYLTNASASALTINSVTIFPPNNANTYNFILPSNYGKVGQVLTSQGANSPLIWTSPSSLGSDSILIQENTITNLKPVIQKTGNNNIVGDTLLTTQTLFQFQNVSSTTPISLSLPTALELSAAMSGSTFSGILFNPNTIEITWIASENISIYDSRSSSTLSVQFYILQVIDNQTINLLLK